MLDLNHYPGSSTSITQAEGTGMLPAVDMSKSQQQT